MSQNLALSWVNAVDAAGVVLSAGSQQPARPVSHVTTPEIGEAWQSVGTIADWIEADLADQVVLQAFGLAGLNLAPTDQIRLRGNPTKPTNVLTRSDAFDHADWSKGGTIAVTANAALAPDGTMTADHVADDLADASSYVSQGKACANDSSTWMAVLHVQDNDGTALPYLRLLFTGGTTAVYSVVPNFATGTLIQPAGEEPAAATMTALGSGWWRIVWTGANNASGNTTVTLDWRPAQWNAGTGASDVAGIGGPNAWRAHLENVSTFAGTVATTTAARTAMPDHGAAFDTGPVAAGVDPHCRTWSWLAPAAAAVRHLRVDLDAASLAGTGFVKAGRFWAGPAWQPGWNMAIGREVAWRDSSRVAIAPYSGVAWPDVRPKRRVLRMRLDDLTEAEALDDLLALQAIAGRTGQLLVIPRPGHARQPVEALIGRRTDEAPLAHLRPLDWGTSFEFEEDL